MIQNKGLITSLMSTQDTTTLSDTYQEGSFRDQTEEIAYSRIEEDIERSFVARKRLFIGLLSGTSLLVLVFLFVFWLIPYIGLRNIHPLAPWVLGGIVLSLGFLVVWSSCSLVMNILIKRPVLFSGNLRGLTIKLFLPLMTTVGSLVGVSKEKVRASFIRINNDMVQAGDRLYNPEEILLLMPHCLQNSRCKFRLTYNIYNCKRCGECPIAGLLNLSDRYNVHIAIATGGTIARRIVVQKKPKLIIAVACERDLSSGIQDTYPLPVYGILNQRPHGPCLDTYVALDHVEWALRKFLPQDSK